jgi:polysaccharide export outer membrane protein
LSVKFIIYSKLNISGMKTKILLCFLASLFLLSCSSTKDNNLAYFKNLGTAESGMIPTNTDYKITIAPDDELVITVTSSEPEATAIYNLPLDNPARRGNMLSQSSPRQQTYIVDKQGYISFPVLGKLKVEGLTTNEIADLITKDVSKEVKDPFVRVELINFYVNVLGEVKSPRRINVVKLRYSVLDAIADAGDLTEFGVRNNVLVIREENGQSMYHRLNLGSDSVFSSPYYYLKQNDIVYVEPNKIRVDNSKYNQNNAFKLSVASTVVGVVSVLASLLIALTVK